MQLFIRLLGIFCLALQPNLCQAMQPTGSYIDMINNKYVWSAAAAAATATAAYFIKKHFFPTTKIAIVNFDSPIIQTRELMNTLLYIKDTDTIAGALLIVQCGGGAPGQSEILYHLVHDIAIRKPIVVQVVDHAASGGYLMIAPATAIVAPALSSVGCIGVLRSVIKVFPEKFEGEDSSGTMEVYPFSAGQYKSIHNPNAPLTDDDKARIQHETDAMYDAFLQLVAQARNLDVDQKEFWAEGKCFSGLEALNLHLIDYIGGINTALGVLQQELVKKGCRIDNLEFIKFSITDANHA